MPSPFVGKNCLLEYRTTVGSGSFTPLAEVVDIELPYGEVGEATYTNMSSANVRRLPTITDFKECNVKLNWVPSDATHIAFKGKILTPALMDFQVTLQDGSDYVISWTGFPKSLKVAVMNSTQSEATTADLVIAVDGAVTYSA